MEIPPEIWNETFLRCLPPPDLIDTSSILSLDSNFKVHQVTRQKKAIIQVCKSWYETGLYLLYEDICIFRAHQLPLLYEALTQSPYRVQLQNRLRRLRIAAVIPQQFKTVAYRYLQQVVKLCPSLASLDFRGCVGLIGTMWFNVWVPPNITCLILTEQPSVNECHNLLCSVVDTLTDLDTYDFFPISALTFPSLLDLTLRHRGNKSKPVFYISRFYTFPALQRVTLAFLGWEVTDLSESKSLCKQYTDGVRMLQIQPPYHFSVQSFGPTIDVQPTINQYPKLEHLVLHPATKFPIRHPHVQWVDIWEPWTVSRRQEKSRITHYWNLKNSINTTNFPNLKGVRTLGVPLLPLHPSVPVIFPPSANQETDFQPYDFKFSSTLHIRHETGRIFCPPLHDGDWSSEDDSDGSYETSETDGETGSSDASDTSDEADLEEGEIEGLRAISPREIELENAFQCIDCAALLERFGNPNMASGSA